MEGRAALNHNILHCPQRPAAGKDGQTDAWMDAFLTTVEIKAHLVFFQSPLISQKKCFLTFFNTQA